MNSAISSVTTLHIHNVYLSIPYPQSMEERQRLLEQENDSTAERSVVEKVLCSIFFHLFAT